MFLLGVPQKSKLYAKHDTQSAARVVAGHALQSSHLTALSMFEKHMLGNVAQTGTHLSGSRGRRPQKRGTLIKADCTTFTRMIPEETIPMLFTASKKQGYVHYIAGNS